MAFMLKGVLQMEPVRKYFNVPKVDMAAAAKKMNPNNEPFSFKGLLKGKGVFFWPFYAYGGDESKLYVVIVLSIAFCLSLLRILF